MHGCKLFTLIHVPGPSTLAQLVTKAVAVGIAGGSMALSAEELHAHALTDHRKLFDCAQFAFGCSNMEEPISEPRSRRKVMTSSLTWL